MATERKCPECDHSLIYSTHGATSIYHCEKCRYQINLNTGKVMYKVSFETDQTQIASCPNCDAQLNVPKKKGVMQLMCPFCSYNWQFDTGVPGTDVPQWHTTCPKCNIAVQVDKNLGLRKITCLTCNETWRFNSDTGEHLPDAKVYGDNILTTCPKCNRKNRVPNKQRNLLITCARCSHQFYLMGDPAFAKKDTASQFASATSSSMRSTTNTSNHSANTKMDNDCILTTCPECGRKHRIPRNHLNLLMTCGECSYRFYPMDNIVITKHSADSQSANTTARSTNSTTGTYGYSQNAKVYGDNILTSCPKCGRKSRVPRNQQNTLTTCGNCSHQFYPINDSAFTKNNTASKSADSNPESARSNAKSANTTTSSANTNTWSANTTQTTPPKESTNTSKENASQTINSIRTITIQRLMHAHKSLDMAGLKNVFMDNYPIHIFLDGKDQGILPKYDTMTLHLDANEHILKPAIMSSKYLIPKGTDSYIVYFFNDAFQIGLVHDPFRDKIIEFIIQIFQGQGIKDRINNPNNRNHNIYLKVCYDGIYLSWDVAKTHGLKQWATGQEEEFISYQSAGLQILPAEKMPSGYWEFVQNCAEETILKDEKANMMKDHLGGFTYNTKHNLF